MSIGQNQKRSSEAENRTFKNAVPVENPGYLVGAVEAGLLALGDARNFQGEVGHRNRLQEEGVGQGVASSAVDVVLVLEVEVDLHSDGSASDRGLVERLESG